MANKMYEEESIQAIAKKIKSLAPLLRDGAFTVAEMSRGIDRVFEEGERKGRNEGYGSGYNSGFLRGKNEGYEDGYNKGRTDGYDDGYIAGRENSQGVELPQLTTPGTADDLVSGKQLIDGAGNIVTGNVPVRTSENVGVIGNTVTIPAGHYDVAIEKEFSTDTFYNAGYSAGYSEGYSEGHTAGYANGYSAGLVDGAEKLKTDEARTVTDFVFERGAQFDLCLRVPSGYYAEDANKIIDIEPYYDEGYEAGLNDGLTANTYEDGNEVAY